MNTFIDDNDRNHLRYAEYVLGVLDADTRAAVTREIAESDEAATAVALWQRHLAPLADDVPPQHPPSHVWERIAKSLRLTTGITQAPRRSLWESLRLWQWIGAGATAIAAACLVVVLTHPRTETSHGINLMVSSIRQTNGVAGWTATMDLTRQQILLLPANPAALADDRNTELWLIPQGGKPIAVGVFKPDAASTLRLSTDLLQQLGPTATLAVSVEPVGGSPTGQPTGPVIASGAIGAAPAA